MRSQAGRQAGTGGFVGIFVITNKLPIRSLHFFFLRRFVPLLFVWPCKRCACDVWYWSERFITIWSSVNQKWNRCQRDTQYDVSLFGIAFFRICFFEWPLLAFFWIEIAADEELFTKRSCIVRSYLMDIGKKAIYCYACFSFRFCSSVRFLSACRHSSSKRDMPWQRKSFP